jgi:hypothetical protein
VEHDDSGLLHRDERNDLRLFTGRDLRLLLELVAELDDLVLERRFVELDVVVVANLLAQEHDLRFFTRHHSLLARGDPFFARQRSRFFPRQGSGFYSRRDARLLAGRDSRFLAELDPLFGHGERGSVEPRRRGLGDPRRPVDAIEIEPGGAVGLDVAKLETIDRGEVQQPHLSNERLEEPLGDKHDARRPAGPHACRHEALNRLGILEAPRVRLEGSHEHGVVRGETEHEQNRAVLGVDRGEIDRRTTEIQIRREDLETGLHRVGVVRHESPEMLQV